MPDVQDLVAKQKRLGDDLTRRQQKAAVAEANAERIKGELQEALKTLRTKYECDSYEEAVALRDLLAQKAEDSLHRLERDLLALED